MSYVVRVLIAIAVVFGQAPAPASKPIVAIFVVDGLRPDSIDPAVTPTLARLQREGVFYVDSHAAFPTVTRVNGATLATGTYPNRHGLVGNTMYVPAVGPTPFSAGEWENLVKLAEVSKDGRLLTVPTFAERLTKSGGTFIAVSSGTTGSGFVLNPESRRGVGAFVSGGLQPGKLVAYPPSLNETILSRFGPGLSEEPKARLDWTERIVRELLLPEHVRPATAPVVLIDWLTEPDSAQHTYGVGSPQAKAGLANSDRNLGLFLETAATLGLTDRLHVIVTSDHGFARHTHAASIGGSLSAAGLKQSKTSDDVVIASNSQAVAIHVKGHDAKKIDAVARFFLTQPWVDLVFTRAGVARGAPTETVRGPRHVRGRVPGTFAIELLRGDHANRGADLLVTLRWSSDPNSYGVPGGQTIGSDSQSGVLTGGASGHGGLSPWVVRNTLIAWGPRFRRAATVRAPAAIVDIAPTVATLIGLTDTRGFDGRVLSEALVDGPDPEQIPVWRDTWRVEAPGYEGAVQVSGTGSSWYVDKGWRVK